MMGLGKEEQSGGDYFVRGTVSHLVIVVST